MMLLLGVFGGTQVIEIAFDGGEPRLGITGLVILTNLYICVIITWFNVVRGGLNDLHCS